MRFSKKNSISLIIAVTFLLCLSTTSAMAEYTVRRGDTLYRIAKKHYGNVSKWSDIYQANKDSIENPSLIYIGQKLQIPTFYIVRRGDSLFRIAKRHYGHGAKWQAIYRANQETIENPKLIYIGQELVIVDFKTMDSETEPSEEDLPVLLETLTLETLTKHPDIQQLIAALKKSEFVNHPDFMSNFWLLVNEPENKEALAFFRLNEVENISVQLVRLKSFFIEQTGLNPENFIIDEDSLKYLHKLLTAPKSVAPPKTYWQKRLDTARKDAEKILHPMQGGMMLTNLIMLEGDILYVPSSPDGIKIYYDRGSYYFKKNNNIVLEIAKKIKEIKPHSEYIMPKQITITEKDGTVAKAEDGTVLVKLSHSYNKLIEALQ